MDKKLIEACKPEEVKTLADIRKVIQKFQQTKDDSIEFRAEIQWTNKDISGKDTIVGISNDPRLYKSLIDGLNFAKERRKTQEKINEEAKKIGLDCPLVGWNVDDLPLPVDVLIKTKLGGKRKGERIRWQIQEGTFEWDPISNKLFETCSKEDLNQCQEKH